MMRFNRLDRFEVIQQLRLDYLRTLLAPMDGMWESSIISQATFWEIQDQERHAGHFCLDSSNYLLRFHLAKEYQAQAQEIFRSIVSTYELQHAITSTIEPLYFALCLDFQKSVTPQNYLFRDQGRVKVPVDLLTHAFRKAEKDELDILVRFYRENTEGPGEWIEPFLQERLDREELFVGFDQHTLVATGECIPSQRQPPYADLGMVVAQSYRGRGLGRSVLLHLKEYCYEAGWEPICSCAVDNHASKKAIERAGFFSEHRMVEVTFSFT
ncbi:MAG: GNAT family N-acetyltransferase [Ktedonobacteraceae bacterium]|nr:GNAT family N-acetyltransferase [Ktedonobacteraceae bacterium]